VILTKLNAPGYLWNAARSLNVLQAFERGARCGVWFLANPVDGFYRCNERGRWSIRREGNITSWRYLVVESDRGDLSAERWLGALAGLPLPVVSIVESGHRLAHAIVRVDAPSKAAWDEVRDALKPVLVSIGADAGAMSAVQFTRLPGCERLGKEDREGIYREFEDGPHLQRLLYLDPASGGRPIVEREVVR
jgi:hypothetical protein